MNEYLAAIKKYAVIEGRASRGEYWMFIIVNFLITVALNFLLKILPLPQFLGTLYPLFVLIPSITVTIRRLHDTNRSGLWWLIGFVPLVGWLVLLFFTIQAGTMGRNSYGVDPTAPNM